MMSTPIQQIQPEFSSRTERMNNSEFSKKKQSQFRNKQHRQNFGRNPMTAPPPPPPNPSYVLYNIPYGMNPQLEYYVPVVNQIQEMPDQLGAGYARNMVVYSQGAADPLIKNPLLMNPVIPMQQFPLSMTAPTPTGNFKAQKHVKSFIDLKKTKMCLNFTAGNCIKGDTCSFAHSFDDLKERPNLNKTKLCEEFEKVGNCTMQNCGFAHGIEELRHTDDLYKTALCFSYTKEGKCDLGEKCRYAHGIAELKQKFRNNQSQMMMPIQAPPLYNQQSQLYFIPNYHPATFMPTFQEQQPMMY